MSVATKKPPLPQYLTLVESQPATIKVDREAGVIRGVKVLGFESKRGRIYPRDVVGKAKQLYEGASVNIDHPDEVNGRPVLKDRPFGTRFGRLKNITESADGLYGDLEFLKSHPQAEVVCEAAERMPDKLGLSHVADCRSSLRAGKVFVESIHKVRSVDIVGDPATNKGLFESEGYMADPSMTGAAVSGEPSDTGAAASGDPADSIKKGFRDAIIAVVDGDEDVQAMITKIKGILQSKEKALSAISGGSGSGSGDGAGSGSGSGAATESSGATPPANGSETLLEKIRILEARDEARTLLESAGMSASDALMEALVALPTKEKRKALIDTLPKMAAGKGGFQPRSASPHTVTESAGGTNGNGKTPAPKFKTNEERMAFLRSR